MRTRGSFGVQLGRLRENADKGEFCRRHSWKAPYLKCETMRRFREFILSDIEKTMTKKHSLELIKCRVSSQVFASTKKAAICPTSNKSLALC